MGMSQLIVAVCATAAADGDVAWVGVAGRVGGVDDASLAVRTRAATTVDTVGKSRRRRDFVCELAGTQQSWRQTGFAAA